MASWCPNFARLPSFQFDLAPEKWLIRSGGELAPGAAVYNICRGDRSGAIIASTFSVCCARVIGHSFMARSQGFEAEVDLRRRSMTSENYQYVPIEMSHPEGRHVDPCNSGSNGGSGERSRRRGNEDVSMRDTFVLEHVGRVSATLSASHLLWTFDDELGASALLCCGTTALMDTEGHLPVIEIFAVKSLGLGPLSQARWLGSVAPKQLHRFEVHTFLRSGVKWVPKVYSFGHTSGVVVQEWYQRMQGLLLEVSCRPKSLLVFVNPFGGKGSGVQTWKQVAPLFELAMIKVKVVETERAGHARDTIDRATKDELNALDGVIVVGGDGFFNEVVNGLVMHRHKAPVAIMPRKLNNFYNKRTLLQQRSSKGSNKSNEKGGLKQMLLGDVVTAPENSLDRHPLLYNRSPPSRFDAASSQEINDVGLSKKTNTSGLGSEGSDAAVIKAMTQVGEELENPNTTLANSNPNLRIGIIPAGSTDTVVISTTGARDPLTSALHIILGDCMPLDLVRVTGWKNHCDDIASNEVPEVRYAASFAGYGFYGDVMCESEELRWLGPARYDMAGFMVFMKHRSYDAEISYLDIPQDESDTQSEIPQGPWTRKKAFISRHRESKKVVCIANCAVCASGSDFSHVLNSESDTQHGEGMLAPIWKTRQTKYHSIGAAVMSCRNDKAPDGVSAHAHLADGLLHLILIRECSRPEYLRQLLCLARRGADPFDFSFVEHCKTPLFTFSTLGDKESVWSVDGELLRARQLTGQVFRGLVNVFARGPET